MNMLALKRILLSSTVLLMFSAVSFAMPVAAHGQSGADSDSSQTQNQGLSLAEQFKEKAKERMQTARQNAKERTQAQRERACTARKAALTRRMDNAVARAKNHKAVFDKIYTRVQNFYTAKKLNVADYSTLTAAANTAQTATQTNIDALQALDITPDCSSQTVADGVSAFQQAVGSTRDSLKSYRSALVNLINSLKGASTSTTNSAANNGGQ